MLKFEIHDVTNYYVKQWRDCSESEIEEKIGLAAKFNHKTVEEIYALLETGCSVDYAQKPNYYYTHGTFKIRKYRVPAPPPKMKKCDCGHTVPVGLIMSTSSGSSCSECYDRMSE